VVLVGFLDHTYWVFAKATVKYLLPQWLRLRDHSGPSYVRHQKGGRGKKIPRTYKSRRSRKSRRNRKSRWNRKEKQILRTNKCKSSREKKIR
jgi:hypothetical protein